MDNKKIMVIIVLGLFVFGGLGMMSLGNNKIQNQNSISGDVVLTANSNQQQRGETREEMVARMHPDRVISAPKQRETQAEMMARMHPTQANNNDNSNENMDTIKFSDALGSTAPDFTLINQDDSKFTLSDYKDKTVVLFFNEGAMCYPACWNQIAALGTDKRFNNDEVITVSIVIDPKTKWDKIISSQAKYGSGTILFDTNKAVSNAYDVLNVESSMHKGSNPGHTYIIIKKGMITYVLDDLNMALNNEALISEL